MDAGGLHPECESLAFLLGTWVGGGRGEYPTIEPFEFAEETTFGHVGKPFLTYSQRTTAADDGRPLHAEVGYVRPVGLDGVELVLALPTGHVEVQTGSVGGNRLQVRSLAVRGTPTAKEVTGLDRSLTVMGDELHYTLPMAAVGRPIIATDAPGCREIVGDDVNGRLIPPRDVASLVDAVTELVAAPCRRAAMGRRGREVVERSFSSHALAQQTLGLYEELARATTA